jgi:hypothetical protein
MPLYEEEKEKTSGKSLTTMISMNFDISAW